MEDLRQQIASAGGKIYEGDLPDRIPWAAGELFLRPRGYSGWSGREDLNLHPLVPNGIPALVELY